MNRGSGINSMTILHRQQCFNEAPIHESGKSLRTMAPHPRRPALQ